MCGWKKQLSCLGSGAIKFPKAGMWVGPLKTGLILNSEFRGMITFHYVFSLYLINVFSQWHKNLNQLSKPFGTIHQVFFTHFNVLPPNLLR